MRPDAKPRDGRGREELRRVYLRRRAIFAAAVGAIVLAVVLAVIAPANDDGEEDAVVGEATEAGAEAGGVGDARAVDRVLRYTSYVTKGGPGKRRVALTFDDGPGPDTRRILKILNRHDAKATFFSLGIQAAKRPGLVRQALRAGHAVGGHTDDHARMGALSAAEQIEQLRLQRVAFADAGLPPPRMFRPPYGSFDPTTSSLLAERRLLMVLWSVETGDFDRPGADAIVRRALDDAEPGAIILMHDGPGDRPQTVAALPRILRGLKARGLEPVTVPQLLRSNPPPRDQPPPRPLDGPG